MAKTTKSPRKTPRPVGPEPERLRLSGGWKENVKSALAKPKPKGGWPKS